MKLLHDAADRRPADRLLPERHLRQPRRELRLGHRHVHPADPARGRGRRCCRPARYGHGGAWGTQAWIDPVKGVAYILMIQRSGLPNSDASDVRRAFQQAAADALSSAKASSASRR